VDKIVLDAFAVLTLLGKEKGYETVKGFLEESTRGKAKVYMNLINWGEVYYTLIKRGKKIEAEEFWDERKNFPIVFVEPSTKRIKEASRIKGNCPVSYADAFCIALAQELKARVLTGDEEFRTIDGLRFIWIR
jgi:predicted nucleic acid-binding protein